MSVLTRWNFWLICFSERYILSFLGCALTVAGTYLFVTFGPNSHEQLNAENIVKHLIGWPVLLYLVRLKLTMSQHFCCSDSDFCLESVSLRNATIFFFLLFFPPATGDHHVLSGAVFLQAAQCELPRAHSTASGTAGWGKFSLFSNIHHLLTDFIR